MIPMRRPSLLAWFLLALGLVVFVSAGRWQHGKAVAKERDLLAWDASSAQPERALQAADLQRADGYDRVVARGVWQSQRYLLDNQIHDSRAGVDVYAPLRLEQGGVLLVSLGWLPYSGAQRQPPALPSLPVGTMEVAGVLTPPTAHGLRLGRSWADVADYPKLMPYFALDEIAVDLAAELGVRVLRGQPAPASGLVQTWHPVMSMPPERHRAYAWQWWSLAIAIVIVFLVVHRRPRSRSHKP